MAASAAVRSKAPIAIFAPMGMPPDAAALSRIFVVVSEMKSFGKTYDVVGSVGMDFELKVRTRILVGSTGC